MIHKILVVMPVVKLTSGLFLQRCSKAFVYTVKKSVSHLRSFIVDLRVTRFIKTLAREVLTVFKVEHN